MIEMCKSKTTKIVIEVTCLVVLSVAVIITSLWIQPHTRGFFCNDQTILYPYVEEQTVSAWKLAMIGLVFLFMVIIGEIFHAQKMRSSLQSFNFKVPSWTILIYHKAGTYLIGGITSVLICGIIKLCIGRLRPHFMNVCIPNINCSLSINHNKYFNPSEYVCTSNFTEDILREARLSFPSGHSSFVTYCGVYFICYMQLRITPKNLKILKYSLQFIVVSIIWFVAMSRISDYWHHWSDVTVGILIGLTNALITVFLIADLFKERLEYHINNEQISDAKNTEINIHVAS